MSDRGRGVSAEGWLHSKVWTDAHMNAKGFEAVSDTEMAGYGTINESSDRPGAAKDTKHNLNKEPISYLLCYCTSSDRDATWISLVNS